MADFMMSPHFSFYEVTRTSHTDLQELNRKVIDDHKLISSGYALLYLLMEPVRARFGPVRVNSCYRCDALNNRVGGTKTSQHRLFEACDFYTPNAKLEEVFQWIHSESGLDYGQVILEGHEPGKPTWIHLSLGSPWREAHKCNQALTWDSANGYLRVNY